MDFAALGGMAFAFGALFAMITIEGASPSALILPGPMILVFGGSIGVAIASTTLPDMIQAWKTLPKAFLYKGKPSRATVDKLVELAEVARKQGLLALEAEAAKIDDPFLKMALQNIADGVDADELRIMMEDEAASIERSGQAASKFFNSLGGFAPTIGIVGTVVSLTHVLENLSHPAGLGKAIAGAFVATLWGVMSANLIWLPIGGRIGKLTALESERLTLITEGVMALQAGAQPRVLGDKLLAMIPEHERTLKGGAKDGAKKPKTATAKGAAEAA
jgi:chemotaxis protein MotA